MKLPTIELHCSACTHRWQSRAAAGSTLRCPKCSHPRRVPADRPRSGAELAARAATAPGDPAAELADRWKLEPEWTGTFSTLPGRDGDDPCEGCGAAVEWEPGRTLTYCRACAADGHPSVALPPAVERYYERQEQRRAELAVRTAPDSAELRAQRVKLRTHKDTARRRVQFWLSEIADEDCYDYAQWQREAAQLAIALRAYLPEIDGAADVAELAAVWSEVDALITSEQGKSLRLAYGQAQSRAERAEREEQQRAEWEQAERAAAAELAEQQRQAERERRDAERERKTIAARPTTATIPSSYATLAAMIATQAAKRQDKLDRNGACAFPHRSPTAADRLYGVPYRDWSGTSTGHAAYGAPQYRACAKHRQAAQAQLNREGYADLCYWELPL